jgi:pimeloyl-ACP methyl ester carboxylesterase
MIAANGDVTTALWSGAPAEAKRPWTAVMLGGLHTGEHAALLIPPGVPVNVLAVDWPWRGPRDLTAWEIVARLGAITRAVLRSPGAMAIGAEAAARARGVDSARVVLVGVSLGVPPALAALRLTRVPRALVLVDGAADLRALMRAGLLGEHWPRWLASLGAALAFRLVRPLEPLLHAEAAADLPVLLISSERDRRLPRAAVIGLHAALPNATVRWRPGAHIRPRQLDLVAALAIEVDAWLREQVSASPRRPAM